jgi:hypothetical protein
MKETMKRWCSFMTFDLPLETEHISAEFAAKHSYQQKEIPQWSTAATRQKMISEYWYSDVLRHFLLLSVVPILLVFLMYRNLSPAFLIAIAAAILISFSVLLMFNYWPNFSGWFLPKLETVKEVYERKQLEQLEKCRQLQLSNFALTLIFYVFDKTSGINSLQSSDHYAGLLMKLYGVDRGSLKANLELILGNFSQKKHWTERKQTEMENRFNEAYQFFADLNFPAGTKLLKELEAKTFMK